MDDDVHDGARDGAVPTEVDARGLACPQPVIMLARAVGALAAGDRVRLLADDAAAAVDIPVWCRMKRQRLLDVSEDAGVFAFVVEVS